MPKVYRVLSAVEQAELQDRAEAMEAALRSVGTLALRQQDASRGVQRDALRDIENVVLQVLNAR